MKKLILTHFQTKEGIFEGRIKDEQQTKEAISNALYRKVALIANDYIIPYEILSQCITSIEEVKEEQKPLEFPLYGKYIGDMRERLTKGKIYKIKQFEGGLFVLIDDFADEYIADLKRFNLVPESEYLKQERKDKPKYDFICPHSGEGFMFGDKAYFVCCFVKDNLVAATSIKSYTKEDSERFAFFHNREDAINWNKAKFGGEKL